MASHRHSKGRRWREAVLGIGTGRRQRRVCRRRARGALRRELRGDVRADAYTRHLFATDASMYAREPLARRVPARRRRRRRRDRGRRRASTCPSSRAAPARAWPARRSAAGALVLDTSRHMDAIGELDTDGAARARRPRRRAGGPQPRRAPPRARLRPRHLDLEPGHDRRDDRQQLVGQPLDRLRHDDRPRARARGRARRRLARARSGPTTRPAARSATACARSCATTPTRSPTATRRHWRQSGGYRLDRLARDVRPRRFVRRLRGHAGGDHRGDRRAGAAAEGAACSRSATSTRWPPRSRPPTTRSRCEPAAVELIDRTILELSRSKLEYRRLADTLEGDPERAAVRDRSSRDTPEEARAQLDRLERAATATTRCAPRPRPSRRRSRRCARPASGC